MRGPIFTIPNIQGRVYAPGNQPNAPGNSHIAWSGPVFHGIPWPKTVPVLNVLANNSGIPRTQAITPVNNQFAQLPSQYLTLGGVVQKSQG